MAMDDSEKALAGSAGLSAVGVVMTGASGLAFLVQPIDVPIWFAIAAVALPTGDVLKVLRARIAAYGERRAEPKSRPGDD